MSENLPSKPNLFLQVSKKVEREIFAPGPTKSFDDFDYEFKPSSSKKPKIKIQDRPTQPRKNRLNGVPIGSNLDEFDVIGGSDLFQAQGYQDDR